MLSPRAVSDALHGRGKPFKVVESTGLSNAEGCLVNPPSSLPSGVAFILCPPDVPDKDCVTINEAVYQEWLKGRGAAWMSGCPEVRYCRKAGSFQICMDPELAASAGLITQSGLAAALDTLEGAALDECVSRHLTEGGDDRLHLNEYGVNKYFCAPRPLLKSVVVRGSCTCSQPTNDGFEAARRMLRSIWVGDLKFGDAVEDVRRRLSKVLQIKVAHEVIMHPSGSDAELIPLAVAQARAERLGCAAICNIVVAAGEVGSGTAQASAGRHFSKYAPNGAIVEVDGMVAGFNISTEVIELPPRLPCGRRNEDFDETVRAACDRASYEFGDPFILLHVVDGSKTGLRIPSRSLVNELMARHGVRIMVCLDACQNRSEPEEINWYLERGACILVTSSKFYQAPGFCGAVVIPKDAAAELNEWNNLPVGFADYLTCYDVPHSMPNMRNQMKVHKNMGLLLRWACGLREMELFAKDGAAVRGAMKAWVASVKNAVRKRAPLLELIDEQYDDADIRTDRTRLGGVNSVVSIKFLSACGSRHLDAPMLRKVHKLLTIDSSKNLPTWAGQADRDIVSLRCMVGQPVVLGEFGVLRLAIGANMARDIVNNGLKKHQAMDDKVLDKMCVLAQFCDDIHHA